MKLKKDAAEIMATITKYVRLSAGEREAIRAEVLAKLSARR